MLQERSYIFSRVNMLVDLGLGASAFFLAHLARNHLISPWIAPILLPPAQIRDYFWLFFLIPVITVIFLSYHHYYDIHTIEDIRRNVRKIFLSCLEATLTSIVLIYMLKGNVVSRGQIILIPGFTAMLLFIKTMIVRKLIIARWKKGKDRKALILVGSGEKLIQLIERLENHPIWGFNIKGIVSDDPYKDTGDTVRRCRIVSRLKDALDYFHKEPVDDVIFVSSKTNLDELLRVLKGCEEMGIKTHISLNLFGHSIAKPILTTFEDIPMLSYIPTKEMSASLMFKYGFDRVAATFLFLLFSPLFLFTFIILKCTSPPGSPVFYGQKRCGLNGKPFTLWKFRSMKVDADKDIERLKNLNEMDGPVFKIRDDPRITRFGRIIRFLSIDELPQLYNVFKGEMSLVGPRPPLPSEVERYDRWQRRRLSMKPGITCLWQVSGRNKLSFDTWMKLDLEYIDNWSLRLDFNILLRTILVVVTGYGAM